MGKEKITTRKQPIRHYKRAGLNFPSHSIRKEVKTRLGGRRLQKNVEIFMTACIEHCITRLLVNAAEKVDKGNYIDIKHLHSAANEKDSEVANVFQNHVPGCL